MILSYLPVLIMLAVAVLFSGAFVLVSHFLGPKRSSPEKQTPYECGVPPTGSARRPVSVGYYLVAILFVVFDVELLFIYPWAVNFKQMVSAGQGWHWLTVMGFFFFLLALGLFYEWRKGGVNIEYRMSNTEGRKE